MDISVVIPAFNVSKYIEQCVTSIIVFPQVKEVVVIDDASTDSTFDILYSLSKRFHKLKIYRNPSNLGRSPSRNIGILNSKCAWLAFCDADDYVLPNRFEFLKEFSIHAYDGAYGMIRTIYSDEALRNWFQEELTFVSQDIASGSLFKNLVLNPDSRFSINSLVVRKNILFQIGLFDESLSFCEDTDLIWRLSLSYNLKNCNDAGPLAVRRIHSRNSIFQPCPLSYARYLFYKKWNIRMKELSQNEFLTKHIIHKVNGGYLHYIKLCRPLLWLVLYIPIRLSMLIRGFKVTKSHS